MSAINEKIKNIPIKEFLIVIILLYLIWHFVNSYFSVTVNWFYIFIILYFLFRIKPSVNDLGHDLSDIFSKVSPAEIFLIVALNIFFSYGMLYLADFLIKIPFVESMVFFPMSLLTGVGSFLTIIFISPVCEELIFRGVFLNKLRIIVPTVFALLISSLIFAALHSFGSIISAFVFAVCMGILYLKTENILVPIFAHFLNNVIAEGIVHLDTANMLFSNHSVVSAVSVLGVASFAVILYYIYVEVNNFK